MHISSTYYLLIIVFSSFRASMIDIMVEVVVTKSYIHTVYIPQPHSVDMKPLKKILQPSNNNSQQSIGKQHLSDFIDK